MTEPTMGEMLIRFENLAKQFGDIAEDFKRDRETASAKYLTKELYYAEQSQTHRRLTDLETGNEDRERRAADTRRQFLFFALTIAVPAILGLLLSVNNFMSSQGK